MLNASGRASPASSGATRIAHPQSVIEGLDRSARKTQTGTDGAFAVWREWGEGEPLVLFHGGAGSWTHFIHQIEPLSRDYRVIAADLPGFGDAASSLSSAEPAEIARILSEGLERLVGPQPVYLTAFSFGSIIAGFLAKAYPARIRGLVLVGAVGMGLPRNTIDLERWRHLREVEAQRDIHRENLARLMIADRAKIDDLAIAIQSGNAARSLYNSRPIAMTEPLRDTLRGTDVPLAAIWGDRDQLAVPYFEERRAWLADHDRQAPFILVPDTGHWVQYETPDAFNEALKGCLDQFAAREAAGQDTDRRKKT